MENAKEVSNIYYQYQLLYPGENDRLKEFRDFISRYDDWQLYDRKNFTGHITASAIVVDPADATVLLLEHKNLKRWLQPGGHVDATDNSILFAALRELKEEADIDNHQVRLVSPFTAGQIPVDIDSHLIPANPRKQEPGHYHHDLRYLFIYIGNKDISFNIDEALNYKWEPFDQIKRGDALNNCIEKIQLLLANPSIIG